MHRMDFIKVCFIDWITKQKLNLEMAMKILESIVEILEEERKKGKDEKEEML